MLQFQLWKNFIGNILKLQGQLKEIACRYMWQPELDADIQKTAKTCTEFSLQTFTYCNSSRAPDMANQTIGVSSCELCRSFSRYCASYCGRLIFQMARNIWMVDHCHLDSATYCLLYLTTTYTTMAVALNSIFLQHKLRTMLDLLKLSFWYAVLKQSPVWND